jgi:hypothetical protein
MSEATLPFAEFLPDRPDFKNPGSPNIKNALPIAGGYKPLYDLSTTTNALTARCQGHFSCFDSSGNTINFAGDATKLYRLSSATWSSAGGSTYATAADSQWRFTQWGQTVIATNFADNIQVANIASGNFADLSGSPPKARYIATVGRAREFLVVANTYDASDLSQPQRVRWAGIGTSTSWTIAASTQADKQDLQGDGGWINGLVGGEYGLVVMERAVWRMDYVGSPTVFEFREIEKRRGTQFPGSVVAFGDRAFWIGDDGFYTCNGAQVLPIGAEKVDRFLLSNLDLSNASRISSAVDPVNKLVIWAIPTSAAATGTCDKLMIYNWALDRWSHADVTVEFIAPSLTVGYTLEQLDNISSSLDALPFSLDSRAYTGGKVTLAGFDSSHKLGYFNGSALTATLETTEQQLTPYQRSLLQTIRPLVSGTSATVTCYPVYRDALTSAYTVDSAASVNTDGIAPVMRDARYHRVRVTVSGGFTDAQGCDVEFTATGTF